MFKPSKEPSDLKKDSLINVILVKKNSIEVSAKITSFLQLEGQTDATYILNA